jgi:hypothetical protein
VIPHRERYVADDDAADLPACPRCGTADTWEARQDPAFRQWLAAIDGCPSRAALAALGRQLYAGRSAARPGGGGVDPLPDPAGGARRGRSARAVGPHAARAIQATGPGALPRLGAVLYRQQRHARGSAADAAITPAEWRRLWAAYRARRPAQPA